MALVSICVLVSLAIVAFARPSQELGHSDRALRWCWTLNAPGDLPLGSTCTCNNECASNRCQGGTCVCYSDSDCGDGWKCINSIFKPNYCVKLDLPIGSVCVRNSQCATGKCQGGHCVCDSDSHCPPDQKCFKPLFSPNYCQILTLPLGASCEKDEQCLSNHCNWGECACKYDHHCPSGKKCKRRLGRNKCV